MVLFKRKPVSVPSNAEILSDDSEVWSIDSTGEVFIDYEQYLHRMDFYKQRRFICEITGHSGLTFFEARDSERASSRDVNKAFPRALREPVLRRVQFSTVSRIDTLVDEVYDEFKQDYYPGEHVVAMVGTNDDRLHGSVREKAKFPEIKDTEGQIVRPAFSRYFVQLDNRPGDEALVDDDHVMRDRKSFTKQILRSFLKNSITREPWNGAPWLVKQHVARDHHIDTEVPAFLKQAAKIAEKKALQAQRRGEHNGTIIHFNGPAPQRLQELKPAMGKSHKSKQAQQQAATAKHEQFVQYAAQMPNGHGSHMNGVANGQYIHCHGQDAGFAPIAMKGVLTPAPPPPLKYPIEDLDIVPKRDGTHRPALKYLSQDTPVTDSNLNGEGNGIKMETVGPLLETWNTLNVYCEIFQLDSFTFDDFIEALQFCSDDVKCELFVEIHCAVLKVLVDAESTGGKIQVSLPDLPDEDSSEEEEEEDETSSVKSPTPEPEIASGRRTRSSLATSEIQETKSERGQSEGSEVKTHLAVEMLGDYSWVDRLRKREFKNGGWEMIIVGLLYQLSLDSKRKEMCEEILGKLAPVDEEPSQETAHVNYARLDLNLRARVIQIICLLTVETKAMRGYMEECSEMMTTFRKEKIEYQRNRKTALEELRQLDDQRKILLPDNVAPSPEPELAAIDDIKTGGIEEEMDELEDSEDEEPINGRSLRRGNDRAAERKRKREEEDEKKEKAKAAAKIPKISNQFKKVLREIEKKKEEIKECEKEIAVFDGDLREADCPRTRCLGKDRFWNRYWWYERNGMPYAGLPQSSTAEASYANGCIWVQGPDDIEREGFIDLPEDDNRAYRRAFQMTIPERKAKEEGPTSVYNARQFGYYEDPDSLDMLIGWLDIRGVRELKLRKELQNYRQTIADHMEKRQEYLAGDDKKIDLDEPTARVSTRKKTYVNTAAHRCLAWHNLTALEELGHIHSEQPRPRKNQKKAVVEDRETRSGKKKGKTISRQGSRYDF